MTTHTESAAATTYTVFAGRKRIAGGTREEILAATKRHLDRGGDPVLIFEDQTGRQVDFDFSGTMVEDVLARNAVDSTRSGPGRPKLGVVSREVSLLPRHWEWLEEQPNGISATLRRLVDDARKNEPPAQRARRVRDAASKFMWSMAGNLPGFEEATRALHAGDDERLDALTRRWPKDIRAHVLRLAAEAAELEH